MNRNLRNYYENSVDYCNIEFIIFITNIKDIVIKISRLIKISTINRIIIASNTTFIANIQSYNVGISSN